MKRNVVIGLLGSVLDHSSGRPDRWEKWRPTVSLCQHDDLLINRFELLLQPGYESLAESVIKDIETVTPETEVRSHILQLNDAWDFEEVFGALHDFAVNYPFDPEREDYLAHITTGSHVAQICMFLLTESRHLPARLLQSSPPPKRRSSKQSGDRNQINGPEIRTARYSIIDLDLSRYDRLAARFQHEQNTATSFLKSGIETRNSNFNSLIDHIEKVAIGSKAPILLTGPTGAGKSRLARRIYQLKKNRRQVAGDFVEVNCATLRGDGAMSALFGHKRGAFTGAMNDRPGLLRAADGGMIFLDEVGELGLDEQAMLLRAIEEKSFFPVGADKEVSSNFQLIAGTNRDLWQAIRERSFREDLLARLNLWTFRLPGLRERSEDIEPNLDYELDRFAQANGRRIAFNKEARDQFLKLAVSPQSAWSANFRDLGAAVMRMGTLASSGRIDLDIVNDEMDRLQESWRVNDPSGLDNNKIVADLVPSLLLNESQTSFNDSIDPFDQAQLLEVLKVCKGANSLSEAGRHLYKASRAEKTKTNDADRLRKYLARFNLDWKMLQYHWSN